MYSPAPILIQEALRARLEEQRWPEGPVCPHCGSSKQYRYRQDMPKYRRCGGCRRVYSVLHGTSLNHTLLPLQAWFDAIRLIRDDPTFKVKELSARLGVSEPAAVRLRQ